MNKEQIEKLEAAQKLIDDVLEGSYGEVIAGSSPWLEIARGEIGVKEIAGELANPRILEYLRSTSLGAWGQGRDETAWCSAFVNWCVVQAGIEGTGSAMARSWLGWGVECAPEPGCIVVLKRGKPPSGHVGFLDEWSGPDNTIRLLGGNQQNAVNVTTYPTSRVLGYRWPAE